MPTSLPSTRGWLIAVASIAIVVGDSSAYVGKGVLVLYSVDLAICEVFVFAIPEDAVS